MSSCVLLILLPFVSQLSTDAHLTEKDNSVKVRDFFGAEGYGYDYFLGPSRLRVERWDDFGNPRTTVHDKELTREQRKEWSQHLSAFPTARLRKEYVNPAVNDGLQRFFTFSLNGKDTQITVRNVNVTQLDQLCEKLNSILPDKLKLRTGGSLITMDSAKSISKRRNVALDGEAAEQ